MHNKHASTETTRWQESASLLYGTCTVQYCLLSTDPGTVL